MRIETWSLERIKPYERNARKIPQSAVDSVAKSLQEYGWQQPIVVEPNGTIVVGHVRRQAAMQLGWKEAPVTKLDALLRPSLTGEDDAPPLPEKPFTQPGDLWTMGEHRLLCGDATKADDVARVLGDTKPFLMVTDPPYGVEYDPTWRDGKGGFSTAAVVQRGKVANDDRVDWAAAYRLFLGSVAYVWHASMKTVEAGQSIAAAGFDVRGVIIWRKQQPLFGQGHYHWQHEPCWYAVKRGAKANWHGDRKQSTVWDVQNLNPTGNRVEERVGHGTQKPVELMRRPILNHTKAGAAVYDPFLGSGSTLIACEATERHCIAMDIDPAYVDVAVRRWMNLTGKQAYNQDGVCFPNG